MVGDRHAFDGRLRRRGADHADRAIIGGFSVVMGMGMFALPAGILANGFAEEMRRRNFVVTWNLVASVPFFENLPASRIAEIAAMLQSRSPPWRAPRPPGRPG